MVFVERWRREVIDTGRLVLSEGRPTIAMETYVRLMVLKARYRWGYRSLVAEVSDSIHLRRFCRISLSERVPDESTVRKLTRRVGAETVNELTRALIVEATRSKRFRPRAVRIDSTVVEADVRYPTDADLASHGVNVLAREGKKLAVLVGRTHGSGAGSLAVDGPQAAGADPHDPSPLRGGEGAGAGIDRADRRAAAALDHRSAEARQGRQTPRARAWRRRQASGGRALGGVGGPLREGRRPDPPARRWASRSTIGSCRSPIRTPGRSARASSASRTCADSVTMPRRRLRWRCSS